MLKVIPIIRSVKEPSVQKAHHVTRLLSMITASKKYGIVLPTVRSGKKLAGNGRSTKSQRTSKRAGTKVLSRRTKTAKLVNRTEGIASVGSAAMDNEECWLYSKMLRALGLVYIEHQARI